MRFIFLIFLLSYISAALGASFECKEKSTDVEWMICTDIDLGALDEKLASLYGEALGLMSPDKVEQLKLAQRAWIAKRNKQCDTTYHCMEAYNQRLVDLKKSLDLEKLRKNLLTEKSSHRIDDRIFFNYLTSYFKAMESQMLTDQKSLTRDEVAMVILGMPEPFVRKGDILIVSNCRYQSCPEKGLMVIDLVSLESIFGVIHYLDKDGKYLENGLLTIFYRDEKFYKEHSKTLMDAAREKVEYESVNVIKVN